MPPVRRGARSSSKELMPQEVKDRGPVRRCGDGRCFVLRPSSLIWSRWSIPECLGSSGPEPSRLPAVPALLQASDPPEALRALQDWLTKQWTESSARLGEDLSPHPRCRRHAALQPRALGPELMEVLDKVGTPDIDVVAVQGQPEARRI